MDKKIATITLETEQRFSKSCIWSSQREFYADRGIEAWGTGQVPFYITSNPFIADCYANLVCSFIQDYCHSHPDAIKSTFYILEMGAGSGQFGFYAVKRLVERLKNPLMPNIKLCYIMSDLASANIDFWQKHEILKPYVEQGVLDYAVFDIEHDQSIHLINQKKTLSSTSFINPLILFANYLFDSIPNDLFHVKAGNIKESRVTLRTPASNLKNNNPINWHKVKAIYNEIEIKKNFYSDPILDQILNEYAVALEDSKLQFPIGSLRCLQNLKKLSTKILLLASDKGYGDLSELDHLNYVDLDSHGSFSVMVNFHAIDRYFTLGGGSIHLQTPHDSLVTGIFAHGIALKDYPALLYTMEETLEGFSPVDYFNVYEHLTESLSKCTLNHLVAYLSLSRWDPYLFNEMIDKLYACLDGGEIDTLEFLAKNLHKVADNFYFIPACDDTYFNIGLILIELEKYEEAIEYNNKSLAQFGKDYSTMFNLGLCYFYLENFTVASTQFQRALELKRNATEAKEWLKKTNLKLNQAEGN